MPSKARTSEVLASLAAHGSERLTVADIVTVLRGRAFALLVVLLGLPNCLPMPPPIPLVCGLLLALVAAQIAAAFGIKIYTIGAGTNGTAWFPVHASGGRVEYRQSAVTLDEQTLAGIAGLTNGKYFRATDAAALRSIYAEIDRLEKTRNLIEHHQLRLEAFPLFVGLGLALLVIEVVLVNTRLRTIP